MKLKNLISFICLFTATACSKHSTPGTVIKSPERLDILWRTPIVPNLNTDNSISINPVLHKNHVVFNTTYTFNGLTAPVLFLDTANGTIDKTWSDYYNGPDLYTGEKGISDGTYLFLGSQWSIECINLETQQTQWHGPIGPNTPYIYLNKGFLYRAVQFNNERSSVILRTPVNQMAWDTVYSFTKTDKYLPGFDSFGFGQLPNGDDVIVWKNRNWGADGFPTDIFAYNITADTLMWRNRDLELNSRVNPLQVVENRVYGNVKASIFSMDLETGELLWLRNVRKSITNTLPIPSLEAIYVGETSIVVKGSSDELVGLVKRTGDINWVQDDSGNDLNSRFTYFEGKLFYACSGLRIVDAQNGDPLISQALSEEIDNIQSNIVIDPDRRVMYFHNGNEAFCVRIPPGI